MRGPSARSCANEGSATEIMNQSFSRHTKESADLLKLAHDLAQQCPRELGEEISVAGSVGGGYADANSDIDMELWVETLPAVEKAVVWLEGAGAVDLIPNMDSDNNEVNIICRYQGVWLEAGWREINHKEKLIQAVMTGQDTTRSTLLRIRNIAHAIPVRTSGILTQWQQALSSYPEVVQQQVILSASEFWSFPHRVEMLWILARRQEVLGLTTWLLADVSDSLRILFAVNRQWETDWKHLQAISNSLAIKPDNLTGRVSEIFSAEHLEQRVAVAMKLILDILRLVPSSVDVSKAIRNIQRSLEANIVQ